VILGGLIGRTLSVRPSPSPWQSSRSYRRVKFHHELGDARRHETRRSRTPDRKENRARPAGDDSGFALFIEILAREAMRSLTASEDEQPRPSVADDVSDATKKRSAPRVSSIVAQEADRPNGIPPAHPTSDTPRASDASQKRLFD